MEPLLEQLRELWRQLRERVVTLPLPVQVGFGVILVSTLLVFGYFLFYRSLPGYTPLFEESLEIEKAAEIIGKIKAAGFTYKTEDGGRRILVKSTDMTAITLKLAEQKALPANSRLGWRELIDQKNIVLGTTKQEFDLNFIRGLQTELENGLRQLEPIAQAKVYINKPRDTLFKEDQKPTTASIILQFKPGREINVDQVAAIRAIVKGAVPGIELAHISILDNNSRDLTRALEEELEQTDHKKVLWKLDYQKRIEKELETKLKTMLDLVFGINRTVVRVTAELDFDVLEGQRNQVVPLSDKIHGVVISRKKEVEEFAGDHIRNSGEPGVDSNTPPGAPSYPSEKLANGDKYNRQAEIENYETSRVTEDFKKSIGSIKHLSISVMCDWQGSEEKREEISKAAQAAVGFDKRRGDLFSLSTLPFHRAHEREIQNDIEAQKAGDRLVIYATLILLLLLPFACLVIYLVYRALRQREAIAVRQKEEEQVRMAENRRKEDDARRQDALFPEAIEDPERLKVIQKLRLKALRYANSNDRLPDNFDSFTPEEQELFKQAFEAKKSGNLDQQIEKLEKVIGGIEKAIKEQRDLDLRELEKKAEEKKGLEERIKDLVDARPDDVSRILKSWMEEE